MKIAILGSRYNEESDVVDVVVSEGTCHTYLIRMTQDGSPATPADLACLTVARKIGASIVGYKADLKDIDTIESAARKLKERDQKILNDADLILVFPPFTYGAKREEILYDMKKVMVIPPQQVISRR